MSSSRLLPASPRSFSSTPFASRAALAVFEPDPARAVNPANAAAYGSNAVPARGVRAIRTERAAARRLWTSPPGVPYPDLP